MRTLEETLRIGDRLDHRFAELRGVMTASKDRSLRGLAVVLSAAKTEYAVIDGIAVQVWAEEPRTTLDIDIAVRTYDSLPRAALVAAGFALRERHDHSENWTGPDGTPVQFSDDAAFAAAIATAVQHPLGGAELRVAAVPELIRAKLRAARDPARRRSKRLMDIADASALAERYPAALSSLNGEERGELGM